MTPGLAQLSRSALFAVVCFAPLVTGCAARAVPFDQLAKAQVTIYKIQAPQPTPAVGAAAGPLGTMGGLANPLAPFLQQLGLPTELTQQANEMLKQWQQMGIPGLPPLPGLTPPAPTSQPAPAVPMAMLRNQYQIVDQRPVLDQATREQLLDLFGDAENFNKTPARCWTPGLAISFVDPARPEPVDVVISLSCGAVNGFGFAWPYVNAYSLEPQGAQQLQQLYQNLFGPIPPQGGV
jgi:hypothetical protein